MAEAQDTQADVMQLWRDWLTQSERQLNAFFGDALRQEPSARAVAGFLETYALFQRAMNEWMQRYLTFVNMPSRTDVMGLGESLRGIEERLSRIEETLQIAAEAVDARERSRPAFEPTRTRRPPSLPPLDTGTAEPPSFREPRRPGLATIPDDLRRSG
jgi:hypothetical protein